MIITIKVERKNKPIKWMKEIKSELNHYKAMAKLIEKDFNSQKNKNYKKEFWEYIKAVAENKIRELENEN